MLAKKTMEEWMTLLLTLSTLLSAAIVVMGALLYLQQHGNQVMHSELLQATNYSTNIRAILHSALTFDPLGIIELGLLTIVMAQILRVGLLIWFYVSIRDYYFTLICSFVLLMLIYSFVWQK